MSYVYLKFHDKLQSFFKSKILKFLLLDKKDGLMILLLLFVTTTMNSCFKEPIEKIEINDKYYYTEQERGTAFTSTVFDLAFYKKRNFWFDKAIGNILVRSENKVDSVDMKFDSLSKLDKIILIRDSLILFDTSLDLENKFDIDIKPKN